MTDALGQELKAGDEVVVCRPRGYSGSYLVVGVVVTETPTGRITVDCQDVGWDGKPRTERTVRLRYQVIKRGG